MCIILWQLRGGKNKSAVKKKKIEKQEENGKPAGQRNHLTASILRGNDRPCSLHFVSKASA